MTSKQRWLCLLAMFVAFVVIIPIIVLYSYGYRVTSSLKIVKTGGIYIANDQLDAAVLVNGKLKKISGILERSPLVKNLKPGNYHVKVDKSGFNIWQKYVPVSEEKVEICYSFLVPSKLESIEIPRYIIPKNKAKKTEINEEYIDIMELFSPTRKRSRSIFTTTNEEIAKLKLGPNRKLRGKVFLYLEKNRIYAKWIGKKDQLPFFINQLKDKLVYAPEKKIASFEFYPNRDDAFIVHFSDKSMTAVEVDTRFGVQNSYRILNRCDKYLTKGEMLFYFNGGKMYKIDFEP